MSPASRIGHHYGDINAGGQSCVVNGDIHINDTRRIASDTVSRDYTTQDRLYKALAYQGINGRRNQLIHVKEISLDWVWEKSEKGPGLVEWLAGEEPLFWVSGKPASGKSTLMRYVSEHDRCYELLQQGSGHEWTIVRFFFDFRAKHGIANSQQGLFRSFLAQLIQKSNTLAHILSESTSIRTVGCDELGLDQLEALLLSSITAIDGGVCMFIDGLDEYEGSYDDLARLVKSLLQHCNNLRICLASRPEPGFQQAFKDTPSIKMQDCNYLAIEAYTLDTLKSVENYEWGAEGLRRTTIKIALEADGVFLWCYLVCDKVCRGMHGGEAVQELRARIMSYPKDLDAFYDRLLSLIETEHQNEAMMMLHLVNMFPMAQMPLFTLRAAISFLGRKGILNTIFQQEVSLERFHKRVHLWVGNLLDVIDVTDRKEGQNMVRRLIHETLRTFLERSSTSGYALPLAFRLYCTENVWLEFCCHLFTACTMFSTRALHEIVLDAAHRSASAKNRLKAILIQLSTPLRISDDEAWSHMLELTSIAEAFRSRSMGRCDTTSGRKLVHRVYDALSSDAHCLQLLGRSTASGGPVLDSWEQIIELVRLPLNQRVLIFCMDCLLLGVMDRFLPTLGPPKRFVRKWCRGLRLRVSQHVASVWLEYGQVMAPGLIPWLVWAPPIDKPGAVDSNPLPWYYWCPCRVQKACHHQAFLHIVLGLSD